MRSVIARTTCWRESAGAIVGVLPLAEVRSQLFGHSLVSTPFCVYGGHPGRLTTQPSRRCVIAPARWRANSASPIWRCAIARRAHPDWPVKDLYVTFRKAIEADEEANMLAIPRKQRAMVRKGIQNGLTAAHRRGRGPLLRHLLGEPAQPGHAGILRGATCEILREIFGDRLRGADRGEGWRSPSPAC